MSLRRDLTTLLTQIEAARKAGHEIPDTWTERVRRLRSLIANTAGKNAKGVGLELQKVSPFRITADDLDKAQEWWEECAPEEAKDLLRATLAQGGPFQWDAKTQSYLEKIS